jgi:Raf kinase inhibitor-like YbhB/YbcL family protein
MPNFDRPQAPNPYDLLPEVPTFTLTSDDLVDGGQVPTAHLKANAGGENVSPHLRWSGAPEGTLSYAVTCFDPDAPTVCGWWHWIVGGIPADVTELARGAGADTKELPEGALHLRNDFGELAYTGSAPPVGDREHRYIFTVHALDEEDMEFEDTDSAASASFGIHGSELGRATLVVTYRR